MAERSILSKGKRRFSGRLFTEKEKRQLKPVVSSLLWSEFDYMSEFGCMSTAPVGAVPWLRSILSSKGKRKLSERLFTQRERKKR